MRQVLIAALSLPLLVAAALPHTRLESSYPAADEELQASPAEVRLLFSTEIQLPLSGIELRGPDGSLARLGPVEPVSGGSNQEFRAVILDPLGPGVHQVSWRTAGPDSHGIRGDFAFTVQTARPPAQQGADSVSIPATPPPTESTPPQTEASTSSGSPWAPLGLIGRWLFYFATVLMIGAAAFRWAVVTPASRRGEDQVAEAARLGLMRLGWIAIIAAVAGAGLRLLTQMGDTGASAFALLMHTPWGWGWWVHLAAVGLFVLGLQLSRRSAPGTGGWSLATAAALLAAAAPVLSGHTWANTTSLRSAALVADGLHVLAAGAWMGGLAALVLVALPLLARAKDADGNVAVLPLWVNAFSRLALVSVVMLFATGAFNTWTRLGGFGNLTGTDYGRTLLIKLGVLAGAAALGFYNWRVVRPSLEATPRTSLLRIPALLELAFGVGVLIVTAALVATHLPQ